MITSTDIPSAKADPTRAASALVMVLPIAALCTSPFLPPWAFMWVVAYALFFSLKWLTFRRTTVPTSIGRALGYLFVWPGMEADSFLEVRRQAPRPAAQDWLPGLAKTATGALILWVLLPRLPHLPPLVPQPNRRPEFVAGDRFATDAMLRQHAPPRKNFRVTEISLQK